jgi:hypothetical protein
LGTVSPWLPAGARGAIRLPIACRYVNRGTSENLQNFVPRASILEPQQMISMPNKLATIKQVQSSGPTKLKSIFC